MIAYPQCRIKNTVTIPVTMKVAVATRERTESREIPHTPWPEVQPLPQTEPKPTRSPAITRTGAPAKMVWLGRLPVASHTSGGAAINHATNANRPANSLSS